MRVAHVRAVENNQLILELHTLEGTMRSFTRPRGEQLIKTLERLRLAFEPKENKVNKINSAVHIKSTPSRKCSSKEERLQACPEASISVPDGTILATSVPVEEALLTGNVVQVGEFKWSLVLNAPRIHRFQAPLLCVVGFPLIPRAVVCSNCTRDIAITQFQWIWYRVTPQTEESDVTGCHEISRSFLYIPTEHDIGHALKIECIDFTGGAITRTTNTLVRKHDGQEAERLQRYFPVTPNWLVDFLPGKNSTRKRTDGTNDNTSTIRVVTYNVLAQCYAETEYARNILYPYVEKQFLNSDYRELRVGLELLRYKADIIGLQEVISTSFKHHLSPLLKYVGAYSGVFARKGQNNDSWGKSKVSSASKTDEKGENESNSSRDGCAIFWDTEKYELVKTEIVPLTSAYFTGSSAQYTAQSRWWSKLRCDLMSPAYAHVWEALQGITTVAVIVQLKQKSDAGRHLLVANTHLFFHPFATHIRLLQVCMLLEVISTLFQQAASSPEVRECGVLLLGDLNNPVDGCVYQLLQNGYVSSDHPDWEDSTKFMWGKDSQTQVENAETEIPSQPWYLHQEKTSAALEKLSCDLTVPGGLALRDSCAHWPEEAYTNFTPNFKARLDYIFYSTETLEPTWVLPSASCEELSRETAIPSSTFPSDHLAVVADLVWKKNVPN